MQQAANIWQAPYDGPANHVHHTIRELEARGHSVSVVANLDGRLVTSEHMDAARPVGRLTTERGPRRLAERIVRRVQRQLRLPYANWFDSLHFAQACQQELAGAALLYERMSWMGYGAGLAARQMGIPLVLEFNGDHLHDLEAKNMAPRGLQRLLSLALMKAAVGRADAIVASGSGWRKQFLQRYPIDPRRVTTIENGTDLVHSIQRSQTRPFCPLEEGPGQRIEMVYLGGFSPWQGVEVLLRAFRRVLDAGVPAHLTLIGAGTRYSESQRQVIESGLSEAVCFTGQLPVETYAPLLAAADIGVSPYCGWKEYSGMKLFDYKAAGLAVVASGEGGQPETLQHGETGWIVPPCDEDALTAALLQFCTDHELRRTIGRAARIDAEKRHGWEQTAAQIENLMQTIIEERRGKP
jgi:glycosyltransferase involved in cell wall biosynthesis